MGVPGAHGREERAVVPGARVRGGGLRPPDERRRDRRARGRDHRRRRHAVVPLDGERWRAPAGSPPTGSRSTCSASTAPRSTTSGSRHEIPFNDPQVKEAAEKFEELWNKDGNVVGGSQGILSLGFGDSPDDLFTDPPGCWMHRQGNFITGFFPDDVQADLDAQVGVTYFPPVEGGYDGSPVLAGGDLAMLLNDTPGGPRRDGVPRHRHLRRVVGAGRRLAVAARRLRPGELPDAGREGPLRHRRRGRPCCASTPRT